MDAKSHVLFGESILEKCGLDSAYAQWSTMPDIDLATLLHRYKRHRFSVLDKIYSESIILHPNIPKEDKLAISLMITAHFYLDIFNAWIFCWGPRCPAAFVPPQVAKEYIEDLHFNLLHKEPNEAIETFYAKSESLFNALPHMSTDEAFTFLLGDLTRHTPFRPTPYRAIQHLQAFIGFPIAYTPESFALSFTATYYVFLNSFFEKW